ncbi:MAG: hypothetical protein IK124_11955 [Prevotella sp.]|nr:hypothetical protein [Prevotella sp.]
MKKIINILFGVVLLFGMTSCELFGLDYQEDADFVAKKTDNNVNMTALQFINSRPDIFSSLIDAIEYTGLQSLYEETGNTFILLTNNALSQWDSQKNCYWNREQVIGSDGKKVHGSTWSQYDKNKVAELLKYHIIKGEYSFHNLDANTVWAETYGEGKFSYTKDGETLPGDTAVMSIMIGYDRNLPIQFNNYEWNYRGVLSASTACCRTTNIHLINGYAHVTDYYLERPTRKFLGQD